jgi:glycosyltransferase involved in cell wall biosynthesis
MLSAFFTPFRSGAEACAEEVAKRLLDRYDITVVTARLRRNLPVDDVISGIPVRRLGWGWAGDKWLFPLLAWWYVRTAQADIVESFAGSVLVLMSLFGPTTPRRILTCQSTNTRLLLRSQHAAAHAITAISKVLLERAKSLGFAEPIYIPNGVDIAAIQALPSDRLYRRILYVGRLEPMKGVDVLLRAFAEMQTQLAGWTLRIVGAGSQRQALHTLAQELSIQAHVEWVGYVPAPAVYGEYAAAEIFCGLSRSEALGNVFLEAQAAGCAVLATQVGGIVDVVKPEVTGLLIASDDVAAAGSALVRLASSGELREKLGIQAKAHSAQYNWDLVAEQYGTAYARLLS